MSTDWSDKKEVLKAVSEDGFALQNASDELKADKEILLAAGEGISATLLDLGLIH
ncbi:uncharacterized protein METZ01_LOCUS225105 [marine metagenome]|uniref:DUF4116 domain-containing protein n=1 Tax=marine metagenome TaxID=408172 RepID=A0A382GDK1_9ZZZZ